MSLLNEFINHLETEVKNGSIYVWGGQGEKPTPDLIRKYENSTTNINRALNLYNKRKDKYPNMKCFDCSGLGVYWLYNLKHIIPCDMNANTLMGNCKKITRSELKKGDWVFRVKNNNAYHIGYVVDDKLNVIESLGRDDGVVKRGINASGSSYWNAYGRPSKYFPELTGVSTNTSTTTFNGSWICSRVLKKTNPPMTGDDVVNLQKALIAKGISVGSCGADGELGAKTDEAIRTFQRNNGLTVDGQAGKNTITKLGGTWVG